MLSAAFFLRLPPATALLVLSSILQLSACHAIPHETKGFDALPTPLRIVDWPLAPAPTPAPVSPAELGTRARRSNTVCGYIGGNPDLPATCLAGSHCAVDLEHGAIGCCPDGDDKCSSGVFTGCVDHNSPPQTVADPYIFTCKLKEVCYKNTFEGGFFQYGCGTASGLATNVVMTAPGKSSLSLIQLSVALTETPTALSRPTTISSPPAETTASSHAPGGTHTTVSPSATDLAAPSSSSAHKNTAAIIGGVVGGIAGLILLLGLAFWLWRRKNKSNDRRAAGATQYTQYIRSPMTENRRDFEPLQSSHGPDYANANMPQDPPRAHDPPLNMNSNVNRGGAEPFRPNYPYGYGPGSTAGGIAAVRGHGVSEESDRVPLTSEIDEFSNGFNSALGDIRPDDHAPEPNTNSMGSYLSRRRKDGRPLWQQNRRRSRNIMWM